MSKVTIRDIRTIFTEPDGIRLVIVKIETSEPGLYGVGCATFTQRPTAVKAALDDYLRPFLVGRNVADIEDIWQSSYVSSYWRNGPVLNNAMSGVDQALWDIKGKMAGMPVHDRFGGKAREAAGGHFHAKAAETEEGGTAMMDAAVFGKTDTVKAFVDAGADVNAETKDGKTVLVWAVERGQTENVKALIEAGADANAATEDGKTALMIAEGEGNTEIADILKQAGARR